MLTFAAATVLGASSPVMAGHDGSCDTAAEDGNLCVYRDIHYQGGMLDFTRTDHNYTSSADVFWDYYAETSQNINDQVSSIYNAELRCQWYLYRDAEFGGGVGYIGPGMSLDDLRYLNSGNANDVLSSHYKWTGTKECVNGST
ncbi:peptidase inhibitor family I36 protein [Microbispora sp. NPDC049125]|uniref:peptidase inhibitor family I36 protein n=1 Tax=Microbispora sp. NPDC049125 TaxID=3154929 RepID=UPI003465EECC